MNKAILVIDMPDKCCDCPCFSNECDAYCNVINKKIDYDHDNFTYVKPIWCPLKELPKEKHWSEVPYRVNDCISYMQGWNACLDKIRSK